MGNLVEAHKADLAELEATAVAAVGLVERSGQAFAEATWRAGQALSAWKAALPHGQ